MTDEQIKEATVGDPIFKELRTDELMQFKREVKTKPRFA